MADIFVSYAREDRERVRPLVDALEKSGWDVWWDPEMVPGPSFDDRIQQAIDAARCVIVVWSRHSIRSDWVKQEADEGRRRNILVPVRMDDVQVPLGFRLHHCADLTGRLNAQGAEFDALLRGIREVLAPEGRQPRAAVGQGEENPTGASARWVMGVLGTVMVLTVVLVWWPSASLRDDFSEAARVDVSQPVPGFSGRAAIAVLPFDNLSGDASQDYFAGGLTEDIITALQKQKLFPVIARNSTFTYKGISVDVREVAGDLGAGYVLEGSVQRRGGTLRVNAQLNDAAGLHLWAEKYDRPLAEVFDVQDDIVANIVQTVVPELTAREMARAELVHPENLEAWDYLLKAGAQLPVENQEQSRAAEELVRKALELDPRLGRAYLALGGLYAGRASSFGAPFDETMAQAIDYARKAKQLDPFDVAVCSCLGTYLNVAGRIEEALVEHETALELNPSSAQAHSGYAWALNNVGRYEDALEHARIAIRLSPRDPNLHYPKTSEGVGLMMLGDLDGAMQSFRLAISMNSSWTNNAHVYLVVSEYVSGRTDAARKSAKRVSRRFPELSLSQLLHRYGAERPLTAVLRDHLRSDFPGDIDSASELEVFGYLLRQVSWDGVLEPQ